MSTRTTVTFDGHDLTADYVQETAAWYFPWPEEKIVRGTLATIVKDIEGKNIDRTAMIVVSRCLGASYDLSRLYAPEFSHMFREASK